MWAALVISRAALTAEGHHSWQRNLFLNAAVVWKPLWDYSDASGAVWIQPKLQVRADQYRRMTKSYWTKYYGKPAACSNYNKRYRTRQKRGRNGPQLDAMHLTHLGLRDGCTTFCSRSILFFFLPNIFATSTAVSVQICIFLLQFGVAWGGGSRHAVSILRMWWWPGEHGNRAACGSTKSQRKHWDSSHMSCVTLHGQQGSTESAESEDAWSKLPSHVVETTVSWTGMDWTEWVDYTGRHGE